MNATTVFGRTTGWLGRRVLRSLRHYAELASFWIDALSIWRPYRSFWNRASYTTILNQFIFTGVDAIPVFTLIALTFGMGITTQLLFIIHTVGDAQDAANILINIVALELGPLITAIILIGRSGTAIAVDLGNMKVKKELQAMEYLGVNIHDVFVMPRIISASVAQLVLATYFTFLILLSGTLFSAFLFNASPREYASEVLSTLDLADTGIFVVKNLLFGSILGGVACFHGLSVGASTTEVPQQTQHALVTSITLVFILDVMILLVSR